MIKQILIVEDEPLIAFSIEAAIEDAGHDVLGIAASVSEALHFLDQTAPDFVTLDFDLGTETTEGLASILAERQIPFALVSGNLKAAMKAINAKPVAMLSKPFSDHEIISVLNKTSDNCIQ
jgi:CheY-like chemotaxis protein